MKKKPTLLSLLPAALLAVLAACDADVDNIYAGRRAFFRFSPVTAAPKTLLPALNSPGEWCRVGVVGNTYRFVSAHGQSDSYPISAADNYYGREWVSGLLVGTPSVPSLSSGGFEVVCFDLVCPNCMAADAVTRAVEFCRDRLESVACSRCGRVYGLQDGGSVSGGAVAGEPNRALLRYRCTYGNDTFVVQN